MAYARQLQQSFPDLDPQVEDLFLLEAHQVAGLPERAPTRQLAVVLHARPDVFRFFAVRHPAIEPYLGTVMRTHPPGSGDQLAQDSSELLWEIADWIVYQRMPDRYDERVHFEPGRTAIVDVAPVEGQVVVDAGAGTGQVTFAVAPEADYVVAVEPVASLRQYIRDKAGDQGIDNVFVTDGFLHAVPMGDAGADVLVTRQAIGWNLAAELDEVDRVLKPDGVAVHLVGMPHPAPSDDELHLDLIAHGYRAGTYEEGGGAKRRYWKRRGES